jgi:hypothetical protein
MGCSSPADDNQAKTVPDFETFEPDLTQFSMDMPNNGTTNDSGTKPCVILPPPVSKTKGSGKQMKLNTNYKPAEPTKKNIKKEEENKTKEEELHHDNESKVSERKITCSICIEKKGHNSHSCPRCEELQNKATGTATVEIGDGKKRKRLCQGCNQLVRGHNVLSCPVIRDALAIARTMEKTKRRKTTVVPTTVKKKVEQLDEDEEEDDYNDDEDDEQDEEVEQDEDEDDEED